MDTGRRILIAGSEELIGSALRMVLEARGRWSSVLEVRQAPDNASASMRSRASGRPHTSSANTIPELPLIAPMLAILVIALTWLATVWYFRRLAQAKFAVIAEIEESLVMPAFKHEWQHFKNGRTFFHLSLTYLEMVVPVLAAAGSAAYILYWIGCHVRFLLR